MASNFDGIQLTPSDDTKRKIATYAVLTGQNVSVVVGQLENLLNQTLSQKCIELLGGSAENVAYPVEQEPPSPPKRMALTKTGKMKPAKSFAEAEKALVSPPPMEEPEEAFSSIEEGDTHIPHHELSADEDTQDNKSLEEQIEEEVDPEELEEFKRTFDDKRFKSVGKNAEAFLDNAMGEPEEEDTDEIPTVTRGYAGQGPYGDRPVKATKSFESRIRKGQRARVSPHTGDED